MGVTKVLAAAALATTLVAACGIGPKGSLTNPIEAGGDPPSTAASSAFLNPCAPPGTHPKFIAILAQGISSSVDAGTGNGVVSFNPATQSYCTSPDGNSPPDNPQIMLQDFADGWLNWKCPVGVNAPCTYDNASTMSYPNDLIDALEHAGGYVLPFSYKGAMMSGPPASPTFTFTGYSSDDVASNDPRYDEPPILDAEVGSIQGVFPSVPIVVIGHSNGGLVAEQWWARYKPTDVAHVFTLDSPVNGVGRAGPFCQLLSCGPVGHSTASAYTALWEGSAGDPTDGSPALAALDGKDHLFTAVGTYGDPLYDVADAVFSSPPHNGILSQFILDPHCLVGEDATAASCAPIKPYDFVSPCGPSQQSPADGAHNNITYGVPGSLLIHSQAKNCPGTVAMIVSYVSSLSAPSPPPSPSPSQTCTAFSAACPDGPRSSSPAPPATSPSPSGTPTAGFDTPQATVAGFFGGDLSGDWTGVCSHVLPSEQAICQAGTSGNTGSASGSFTIVRTVVHGTEALVAVTGKICAPGSACASNTDPSAGMPSSAAGFQASYNAAVAAAASGTEVVISPVPCTQIGGKWYVTFV